MTEQFIIILIATSEQGQQIHGIGTFKNAMEAENYAKSFRLSNNERMIILPLKPTGWYETYKFPRLAKEDNEQE